MKEELTSREKAVANSINLRFETRDEREKLIPDYVRFVNVADYPDEDSLQWFNDENLRSLFRELYHVPAPNLEAALTEALRRSNESPRVKQVVDRLRRQFIPKSQ